MPDSQMETVISQILTLLKQRYLDGETRLVIYTHNDRYHARAEVTSLSSHSWLTYYYPFRTEDYSLLSALQLMLEQIQAVAHE